MAVERAGANRIELCTGIVAGGVTPSMGLFRACKEYTKLPIMAMIRPREGGFCYSHYEFATMVQEVDAFKEAGAYGVVFGILMEDGRLDVPRMKFLRERAGPMHAMCHRAFDVTPDPFQALDDLVECGFDRVLSSGQTKEIVAGLPMLSRLMEDAAGRIEVQPCEGIRPENVRHVIETLNPTCIHLGPFKPQMDPTSDLGREVNYGEHLEVDEACVGEVVRFASS
jgi:copper homeostasis protein